MSFGLINAPTVFDAVLLGIHHLQGMLSMDPTRIRADWLHPTSLRLVQHFLGFPNKFCRFVQNFSPSNHTDPEEPRSFLLDHWGSGGIWRAQEEAYKLPGHPIAQGSKEPFIIEFDESDVGVGVVLLQQLAPSRKLQLLFISGDCI